VGQTTPVAPDGTLEGRAIQGLLGTLAGAGAVIESRGHSLRDSCSEASAHDASPSMGAGLGNIVEAIEDVESFDDCHLGLLTSFRKSSSIDGGGVHE